MEDLYDESGLSILAEDGGGIFADAVSSAVAVRRHAEALALLMPVQLGDIAAADIEIEGRHLDAVDAAASALRMEMHPDTCYETLEEWERVLGLPDPCVGTLPTVQQRVAAVAAKWAERRTLSVSYLVSVAALMGYAITVTSYPARRYGAARSGSEYFGPDWSRTIAISAPLVTLVRRSYGTSNFGEQYSVWGNEPLECAISRLRPAHVYVMFIYS